MIGFLKNLFRKKEVEPPLFSDAEYEEHYEAKKASLERLLGSMYERVGHAVIPFHVGGAVDMYYFPQSGKGTAMVTMELIEPDGTGPEPNQTGTYELIAFTRHSVTSKNEASFEKIERRVCDILTMVGNYSYEATLEPGETCELPNENGDDICLLLDRYPKDGREFTINGKRHGLLLCIEIFRSEMEFAMKNGSAQLIERLKQANYYPYSDMDRDPVA